MVCWSRATIFEYSQYASAPDPRVGKEFVVSSGPRHPVAGHGRIGQDLPGPVIGREGFALFDAERAQHRQEAAIAYLGWLRLEHGLELLPVAQVVGLLRRPLLAANGNVLGDAGPGAIGPGIQPVLAHCGFGFRLVRRQAAWGEPHLVGGRAHDDVAGGLHDLAAGRQDQVLATLAFAGPPLSPVGDGALPNAEHAARGNASRHVDHQRALSATFEKLMA